MFKLEGVEIIMNHFNLLDARKVYERGDNVTEYLREKMGKDVNTSEIIEIAYDLQAGSYISAVTKNLHSVKQYTSELAKILSAHVSEDCSMLDIGTGEMTTLTFILNEMDFIPKKILAFDISWSRLIKGKEFFCEHLGSKNIDVSTFVADIKQIPLHSGCVDIVISNHALEPNGKNLPTLLSELFRVVKKKIILFEPSYELNSDEGRARMDRLGYIKGVQATVEELGGRVVDIIPIKQAYNPLNPTACYVIEPPKKYEKLECDNPVFCVPGTNFDLIYEDGFYASKEVGLVFPILQGVPILKSQNGILATAKY